MHPASASSHLLRASILARSIPSAVLVFAALVALSIAPRPLVAASSCSWLSEFEVAYERGDVTAYGALLAPDFRFHFGDAENRRQRPQGWNKEEELISYTNIHRGVVRPDGTKLPRARSIDVQLAGVRLGPDPEVPGSADHLLAYVQAATLIIQFEDGRDVVDTAPHAFHLVRGKAIGLTGADAQAWFARTWIERPTDAPELLAAVEGTDADGGKAAAGATAGTLALLGDPDVPATAALRATLPRQGLLWPNPVRSGRGISLAFDLVADAVVSLEVFDVRGRIIAAVAERSAAAGRHSLAWDGRDAAGQAAPAGSYFVRARLGDRDARHRVIILR
jgi:hypothetical protein